MQKDDERWLRRAIGLADKSVDSGDYAFGAVLISANGELLLESGQTVVSGGGRLGHAEMNVLVEAGRRWPLQELARCTLYSSTEPCPMCSGAAGWSVGRLVFGLSQATMYELFADPAAPPRFASPWDCRSLLSQTNPPMEIVGPMLQSDAAASHRRWLERQAGAR